ncbi:hypothetical protein RJ640_021993 [Escallonia rubra]|uniref:Uncharacterized protein n=1 Tax=Escallonia rubra TaxID=112253 RepID=A0AA88QZP7_9ASTE|nr:hypothetical protein RJ640_021993 [Escallonia rubra]
MDLSLYRPAMEGKVDIILQDRTKLAVLHIAAMFGNTECANEVLRYSPSLSCRVNIQGDTPLHIASRKVCSDIVQALVKRVGARKEMLRMLNKESDTPLHEAVRNCHFDVVKLLVEEDPDFFCPANNAEETPFYLASEKGYDEFVSLILETCTALAWRVTALDQFHCLAQSKWGPGLDPTTVILERAYYQMLCPRPSCSSPVAIPRASSSSQLRNEKPLCLSA